MVAGAYLTFLWLPISPEKIVTLAIALGLLQWLFPNDQKTLAVLKDLYDKAKRTIRRKKKVPLVHFAQAVSICFIANHKNVYLLA